MTVYLDVVLIENLAMNYVILLATAIVNKVRIKHLKIFISSVIGAIYSILTYVNLEKIGNNVIVKIIFSVLMIYVAFKPQKPNKLFKQLLIFYLTTFAFGGVTFFLIYTAKPNGIFFRDGVWIGTYPIKIAIAGALVGFSIIYMSFKLIKNGISKDNMMCEIEIIFEEKRKRIKVMVDSGNLLRDPISKVPVVVVEKEELKDVLPEEIVNNVEKILKGETVGNPTISKYISKFKVIPFSSIGTESGILLGVKVDGIKVCTEDEKVKPKSGIIGIYNKPLCRNGEYKGLIGLEFVEKEMAI